MSATSLDQAEVKEPGSQLLAQALDVHGRLGREVDDVLQSLRRTAGVYAAGHGFSLGPGHRLAANGTPLRHLESLLVAGAVVGDGPDDLRDHIPRPLDYHGVPNKNALILYVVLVVERGPGDGHPPDVYRRKYRLRRQRPGPADVNNDVLQLCPAGERLELVRYRPPRGFGDRTQRLLLLAGVYFHYHAVDLVPDRLPLFSPPPALLHDRLYVLVNLVRIYPQPVAF